MSLRFLFGPAGSGKSTKVQKELIEMAAANPDKNFLLIVPDQFTMQTQMDIVKLSPNKGILNIDVLSFGRLSYRVFSETGMPDYPVLDDTGKSLVLRRVASKVADSMPYIGRNLGKIGYIHEIKSSISEFMQYGLSPMDVTKLSESLDIGVLKNKLSDLAVIYNAFCDYNREKFVTSEETLDILCKKLPEADFIRDSYVVFDGFTGFTPIQERVILSVLMLAKKVTFTFTLSTPEKPSDLGGEEKLFHLSRRSANRLRTLAKDNGIVVEEDECIVDTSAGRFANNKELAFLEKNLFRHPFDTYKEVPETIKMFSTPNIESEVSNVCLQIHELVRKEGYAYRDIAVVVGDMSSYGDLFENRMKELDMPVFVDRTRGIVLNPFIEYLKSALRILVTDYSYDAVFHYLKSGFTSFSKKEVNLLDKYVSGLNIFGRSRYGKEFKKLQKGMPGDIAKEYLPLVNQTRETLMEDMAVLERKASTASEYVRNLYDFLKANDSYGKLRTYENEFEEQGDLSKAKEYGQIYRYVMELLNTIVSLVGDEPMSVKEFYDIFEAGIAELEIGLIPKNVDRILVGDIERTRLNQVKALFFVGVNDGNIPKNNEKGGIISDYEKELLLTKGYELAPGVRETMYTQRLYLYTNLCKPKEKLFISYSGTGSDGKGILPSYLWSVIRKMYPKIVPYSVSKEITVDNFVTYKDSYRYYAELMRKYAGRTLSGEGTDIASALLDIYREIDSEGLFASINDAAFLEYEAGRLSEEIVRLLYGKILTASISKMEMFAGCAYSFFLKYGMELKENEEYDFDSLDLGTVYHGVLDFFSKDLQKRGIGWDAFSKEEGERMTEAAVASFCENYQQGMLKDDAKSEYTIKKITKIMKRTIDTLQFHITQGSFVPEGTEFPFEREVELENGSMLVKGKIDRIDICKEGNNIFVKVLDYKSGRHDIDVTQVYYGLEQQLAVYMNEALLHEKELHPECNVSPSALLYYTIDNPIEITGRNSSDEEILKSIRKDLKVSGLLTDDKANFERNDKDVGASSNVIPIRLNKEGNVYSSDSRHVAKEDEITNMISYVNQIMRNIGERIYAGDISISPVKSEKKDSCKNCSYCHICPFDKEIRGYSERKQNDVNEEEARNVVMGGNCDGSYLFN